MKHGSSSLSFLSLRLTFSLLALLALLAGCGDVRSEQSGDRVLTLEVPGAHYVALKDGDRPWRALNTQAEGDLLKVTLSDPKGRYGVMGLCLDAGGNVSATVQQGILSDTAVGLAAAQGASAAPTPLITLSCSRETLAPPSTYRVSGRVSGLAAGEYGSVYVGGASALVDFSAPEHRLELPPTTAANPDLIAARYEAEARVPSLLVYRPGLTLDEAGTTADVDFAGPDVVVPEVAEVPLTGVRPGELLSGSVELVTQAGTTALLGEFAGEGVLTYARPPAALLRGAALRAAVQSFAYNDRTKAGSSRSAVRTFAGGLTQTLALPRPLTLSALTLCTRAPHARPYVSWRAQGGSGSTTQFYSQVQAGRSVSYRLRQSAAYLQAVQPDAALFSSLLPDFSGLPEWQASWNLRRGQELFWDISHRRVVGGSELVSSRSGVLTPTANPAP